MSEASTRALSDRALRDPEIVLRKSGGTSHAFPIDTKRRERYRLARSDATLSSTRRVPSPRVFVMLARRPLPSAFALALALCVSFVSSSSSLAFCRATTCQPEKEPCPVDRHGCATNGEPLYWPGGDASFLVDARGSALRGVSEDEAHDAVSTALATWTNATCANGSKPALDARVTAMTADATASYVEMGANENVIVFHDADWPYAANALGKTLLAFGVQSGKLLDADVELNTADYPLSADPKGEDVDVVAVLTHEMGHTLGLDHSDAPGATMQPETTGFATSALRTLEPDDVNAICAVYPPRSGEIAVPPEPGCGVAPARGTRPLPLTVYLVTAMLALSVVRRRGTSR